MVRDFGAKLKNMMKKTTIKASPDIALVKYWGKKNETLRLPENGSISIVLDGLHTITTVEFDENLKNDQVEIEGQTQGKEIDRVKKHLSRIRQQYNIGKIFAKVVSKNNFPKATGLSSSGSGFAVLTYAAILALDLDLSEKDISILARRGSGTACRCVCGGFVEWLDADKSENSYSHTLFPASYWDIRDIVAIISCDKKSVSSTKGHTLAKTSVFYKERQKHIKIKLNQVKQALKNKDFTALGNLVERETLEFHSILLTSNPPLIAWYLGSIEVMLAVQQMRQEGIEAYFTISTGFNVHVLTLPKYEKEVLIRLKALPLVKKIIQGKPGKKPQQINEHLF